MKKIILYVTFLTLALILEIPGAAMADYIWSSYGGHEYTLTKGPYTDSWTAAETEAVGLGGHLATINNTAEETWLLQKFLGYPTSFWIGLHLEGQNWVWSSGEPVTYTNWEPGQPRVDVQDYNYALIERHDWYGVVLVSWFNYPDWYHRAGVIERNAVVPIPGSVLLLGSGLAGLGALRWRRRKV